MGRITRRTIVALAPLAPLMAKTLFSAKAHGDKAVLYIGTYTHDMGPGGHADGIYMADWDGATGVLSPVRRAAASTDPSYVVVSAAGDALYAVNEYEDYPQPSGGKGGSVSAFHRDRATGALTARNTVASGGADPCHITVDRGGRAVFVANYASGTISSYQVTEKGLEGPVSQHAFHGHGPNRDRQEGPHAHCVRLSPDERFLLVSDLGSDTIVVYRTQLPSAVLTQAGDPWRAKPGSGPRHMRFHPNGRWLYSLNELASTLDLLAWNSKDGTLIFREELSLLADSFHEMSSAAEVVVDRRGRFLYASNRGEDTIAAFSIDVDSGRLTFLQRIGCGGKNPRDFTLDPTERWLLVANQDSQNVVVFARDLVTGRLTPTGRSQSLGAPVSVTF